MRLRTILAITLGLSSQIGCIDGPGTDKDDEPQDTSGEPDTGDTGDDAPLTDYDHDGYFSDVDCDDGNALVYPDAPELCDGVDNDCDEEIDEGYDADGDGFDNMIDCEEGTDCDDDDDDIHPDAEETPYDYIDQDCDGSDLTDVDGDGFDGEAIGGDDCDDWDETINPDAEEIVKDGIDQDCTGQDDIDGDGDGYGDIDFGGDDCDDEDPTVNPSATDFSNDGVDTNCDDDPDTIYELDTATMVISSDPYQQALVGSSIQMCDLDEDGMDDLVLGAPFDDSYSGTTGVWYGLESSTWTSGMEMADADTLITGDSYGFLGFNVLCEDFDGDGHQDLVLQRGEINYSTYVTDWSLMFFYGDGTGFGPSLYEEDADAELVYQQGVPVSIPSVYSTEAEAADLDGDGAAEILLSMGSEDLEIFDGEQRIIIVPGGEYYGDSDLSDHYTHLIAAHTPNQIAGTTVLPDMDGDGQVDILVNSYGWASNYDEASDENSSEYDEYLWEGRVDWIGALPAPGEDLLLEDLSWGSHVGSSDQLLYGFRAAHGDFDCDGAVDIVVSSIGDSPSGTENGGGIFLFSDAAADLGSGPVDPEEMADAIAYGDIRAYYTGYDLSTAGDVNGDGCDDLLVSAPGLNYIDSTGATSYPSSSGWVYLISGALFDGDIDNLRDVSLLAWRGEDTTYDTGSTIRASGDIDGDGINDIIIGEQSWGVDYTTGKAYIYLSSQF